MVEEHIDNAITVDAVSKSFHLPHEIHSGIKQLILSMFRRNKKRGYETQRVLKGISFSIKKGEFLGIVGRNGSGKSTLLKLLSGIYTPDRGSITVNGTLTPFIELGVGFNPELTGRENVYLNGALLGFGRKEIDIIYNDIVDFAELENFMDQKLKNYSSGMQVRLAFSIAIQAKSDILVLDEVLAVGDEAFQRKCFQYFEELKRDKRTVILVTHSMDSVRQYCDRAIMVKNGKIIADGSPDDVANQYSMENLNSQLVEKEQKKGRYPDGRSQIVPKLNIKLISEPLSKNTDNLSFEIEFETTQDIDVYVGFSISNNGLSMIERNSAGYKVINKKGTHSLTYMISLEQFSTCELKVSCGLFERATKNEIAYTTDNKGSKYIKVTQDHRNDFTGGLLADESGTWK